MFDIIEKFNTFVVTLDQQRDDHSTTYFSFTPIRFKVTILADRA